MRGGGIIGAIVVIWLIVGAIASFQRDYFKDDPANCATAATIALTVLAGPLNYFGVNPKVNCDVQVPQPSASGPTIIAQPVNTTIGVAS
ncbi:MAG: hypothetical protein WAM92_08585 [Mycobacterium sp.]